MPKRYSAPNTVEEAEIEYSVVVPLYNEEQSIRELCRRTISSLTSFSNRFELIFVDDGSTDNSYAILKELHLKNPQVKAIRFRKNFGKAAALSAGFTAARGKRVITIDADLQDLPEEIPLLINKMDEGYDLVSGWKFKRHDPLLRKVSSKIFNWVTSFFTGVKLHDFNCGLKCYQREVIEELDLYGELHRYIPALAQWKGFKVGEVKVEHRPRLYGKSKYGGERYIRGFFDLLTVIMLTKYPQKPLHFFGLLGTFLSLSGFAINLYLAILRLSGNWISNRPLLLLGILLLILGIQFIFFGLMGELIIFASPRNKSYVIRDILDTSSPISDKEVNPCTPSPTPSCL